MGSPQKKRGSKLEINYAYLYCAHSCISAAMCKSNMWLLLLVESVGEEDFLQTNPQGRGRQIIILFPAVFTWWRW